MGNIVARFTAVLLLILSALTAYAGIETKRGQLAELDSILLELETHNGGIKFKDDILGITYDGLRERYARLINDAVTLEEANGWAPRQTRDVLTREQFEQLMIALGAEFQDGHLNILRVTRDGWTLGIRAAEIDGRLFVTGFINDLYVQGTAQPLQVGDEIVAINGITVQDEALTHLPYQSLATYATRFAAALESTMNHGYRRLAPEETGAAARVTFVRTNPDGQRQQMEGVYHWMSVDAYYDDLELFDVPGMPAAKPDEPFAYGSHEKRSAFSEGLSKLGLPDGVIVPTDEILNGRIRAAHHKAEEGQTLTPRDIALLKFEPVERLSAYTVRYAGKTFGVLRIPDYSPAGGAAAINELRWIAHILQGFEATTHGLIIDQLANGGGMVMEVVQLTRLFATQEMEGVTIDMRLSRSLLDALENWANTKLTVVEENATDGPRVGGNSTSANRHEDLFGPQNYARVRLGKNTIDKLRERWRAGEKWSGPMPFMDTHETYGTGAPGRILPREDGAFTKPILIMNDSRSASGGDFFPALMQANGRAVIYGETSMGLGMPVFRQTQTPGSELFMRCPFGMCIRPDGLPIENLGVLPDVPRYVTDGDLREGFVSYALDALDTMDKLVMGKTTAQMRANLDRRHGAKPPKKASFRALRSAIQGFTSVAQTVADPAQLLNEYRALFTRLLNVQSDDLTLAEWQQLHFPLPRLLTDNDVFLASMRRNHEVRDRLATMARLPQLAENAPVVALIGELHAGLAKLPYMAFGGGCYELLMPSDAAPLEGAPAEAAATTPEQ